MKIAKITIKRINDHSNINKSSYNAAIYVIAEILNRAAIILGDFGGYEINDGSFIDPWVLSDGSREFVSSVTHNDYEKKIVRGLATKYPDWISGTFTHGLNGVDIYDVNKLVKAILDDNG